VSVGEAFAKYWKFSVVVGLVTVTLGVVLIGDGLGELLSLPALVTFVGTALFTVFTAWVLLDGIGDRPLGRFAYVVLYLALMQGLYLVFDYEAGGLDDWTLLLFIACGSYFILWITGFWRHWLFLKRRDDSGAAIVFDTAGALLMLTMAFAVVTGVLVAKGVVETDPARVQDLFLRTEAYYLWHMVGAIPGLDTPETLRTYETTDATGGALLLSYNVLVILPVLSALASLFRRESQS
jgi:hypothetical protein